MFKALQHVIASTFNAHRHRVHTLHGDCEKVNTSLAGPLGFLGITLQTSPPGEHAARVERSILTLRQLSIATLSALPYHLSLKYTLHLHKAIAAIRNTLINIRSSPSTPDKLLRGSKPSRRLFQFGTCCMVMQHSDNRHALAHANHTAVNTEPKAELGVCMGPDLLTGCTLFLLANGSAPHHPFPALLYSLRLDSKALRTPHAPPTHPPLPQSPNSVIQLPDTPHIEAIASVTGYIPSPLPTDLLSSLQVSSPMASSPPLPVTPPPPPQHHPQHPPYLHLFPRPKHHLLPSQHPRHCPSPQAPLLPSHPRHPHLRTLPTPQPTLWHHYHSANHPELRIPPVTGKDAIPHHSHH